MTQSCVRKTSCKRANGCTVEIGFDKITVNRGAPPTEESLLAQLSFQRQRGVQAPIEVRPLTNAAIKKKPAPDCSDAGFDLAETE